VIDDDTALGWIHPDVAAEFPELRLWWTALETGPPRTSEGVQRRLRDLAGRIRGPQALLLRRQPIPHAYRVFYRHIGIDPDVQRIAVEQLVVERLKLGGFPSGTALEDALTIAIMETHVPVWALDAATLRGSLGIRPATEREPLGRLDGRAPWLPAGRLAVVDDEGPVAVLFGDLAPGHEATPRTREAVLFSVQVGGVPHIHVSEALWTVAEIVERAGEE
jgi:DNA/RNA-binding domain of Phe-tRNA-synthetase-like protein